MSESLSGVGAILLLIGTLVVLGFRRGNEARGWVDKNDPLLGSSSVANVWNNTIVPRLFGIQFVTFGLRDEEERAITAYGEVWLTRLGWAVILLGALFQVLGYL